MFDILIKRGFDCAEAHWALSFFCQNKIFIKHPFTEEIDPHKEIRPKATMIFKEGSEELLRKIIDAGRIGLDYTFYKINKT